MKTCPQCTTEAPLDGRFCEECGAPFGGGVSGACPKCGAGAEQIDEDGFCQSCGIRRQAPARDHFECVVSPRFAGVSDRGIRHHRNEDFFVAGMAGEAHLMVVCDGVSSTAEAQKGSEAATVAAFAALLGGASLAEAVAAAQSAIAAVEDEPASTIVAAVVQGGKVQLASAGDSRAYWIAREGSRQLTTDDSWIHDVVSSGRMTEAEAMKSSEAHAITRWLGADAADEDCAPSLVEFEIPGPGFLLLCSDGLWNYAPQAAALAEMVFERPDCDREEEAVETVRRLVDFAKSRGGQDNITAVLLRT